jgi:hypothetical protein
MRKAILAAPSWNKLFERKLKLEECRILYPVLPG